MSETVQKDDILTLEDISKTFGEQDDSLRVVDHVNLSIKEGEFISFVGPSGCGKSTLFRIIGGLDFATQGRVMNKEREIKGISNNIGMVFQEARLFPWLNVYKNVKFGIDNEEKSRLSKEEVDKRIRNYLELVGLSEFAKAYPNQLSGGMQQRASIARILVENPEILLLDEPFSALDAFTKMALQNALLTIRNKTNKTMILVTHDIDEAVFLSDRVVVLSERPATIKKIFNVKLSHPRDRSSVEFVDLRRRIMMELYNKKEVEVEYYI